MGMDQRDVNRKIRRRGGEGGEPSSLPVFLLVPFAPHSGPRTHTNACSLLSVTTFRNQQQPYILQEAQHRFSTHFAAVLQNKLHVFIATIRVNM